jgi:hypothetical protein
MAITKVPTYGPAPKKIGGITIPSNIGYSGSGWNYPSANVPSGSLVHYATTPNTPPSIVPLTPAPSLLAPPPSSPNNPLNATPSQAPISANWNDYLNEAMGMPQWQAATANYNSLLDALRGQLKWTANSLVTNTGYDISGQLQSLGLGDLTGDLTPDAAAVAAGAANPLSAKAQIDRQYQQGSLDALYNANARGTLGSGASTAAGNQLLQNSQLQANQAQMSALDSIRNAVGGYTSARANALTNLQNQQAMIMQGLAATPGPVYGTGDYNQEPATSLIPGTNIQSPVTNPNTATRGVDWGGQTFTSVPALTKYLANRGVSYASWRGNHPAAAAKLEGGY